LKFNSSLGFSLCYASPAISQMKSYICCLLAVLGPITALHTTGRFENEPSAVTRVVQLLQELQARIQQDQKDEQQAYDKYACWCETMTSKKSGSIARVKAELQTTGHTILRLKGGIATKTAEIKVLAEDIRRNEEAQQKATVIRQKENEAFVTEKVEMEQALSALEKAIIVLRDATESKTLLQRGTRGSAMLQMSALETVMKVVDQMSLGSQAEKLSALRVAVRRYAPQSQTIQGILKDMYETFATNLETRTIDEATAHRKYEDLMAAYKSELLTLQDTLVKKEQAKAESEIMLADASQAYGDAEAQLKADIAFFDATKTACEAKTDEWSQRKTLRAEELDGIAKALSILTSSEAQETFGKAIKPGFETFVQIDHSKKSFQLKQALKALQVHARQSQSIRLAALAARLVRVKSGGVGHFDKVIEEIDKLMVLLQAEEQEDQKKVDDCKTQLQEIALSVQDLQWKIDNNNARITKLDQFVKEKEAEKASTIEEIETVNQELKLMQIQRTEENTKFLEAKDDDKKAIELLEQTKAALVQYYKKHGIQISPGESLVQFRNMTEDAPPEAKFSEKGARKLESKGIVSILSMIIQDLKQEIANGIKNEEAAQIDYERSAADATKLRERLTEKKTNLEEIVALQSNAKSNEETVLSENQNGLKVQQDTKKDITPSCDFAIKSQEERRQKRKLEMDGLRQAKEYLADARPAMLEVSKHSKSRFDDNMLAKINFQSLSF